MKIKTDFITNSSSTSFIVMTEGEFTLPDFIRLIGIDDDSIFRDVFERLFECFKNDMVPLKDYLERFNYNSVEEFMKDNLCPKTYKRFERAISEGKNIFVGQLDSDSDHIESFFCCDAFIIEGDTILIDATSHAW